MSKYSGVLSVVTTKVGKGEKNASYSRGRKKSSSRMNLGLHSYGRMMSHQRTKSISGSRYSPTRDESTVPSYISSDQKSVISKAPRGLQKSQSKGPKSSLNRKPPLHALSPSPNASASPSIGRKTTYKSVTASSKAESRSSKKRSPNKLKRDTSDIPAEIITVAEQTATERLQDSFLRFDTGRGDIGEIGTSEYGRVMRRTWCGTDDMCCTDNGMNDELTMDNNIVAEEDIRDIIDRRPYLSVHVM